MEAIGNMPSPHGGGRPIYAPKGLEPVRKRFTYHPERHNSPFYEEVADIFKNGRYVPFPLGKDTWSWPAGIEFTFEHAEFIVLLPPPSAKQSPVGICPKVPVEAAHLERAAHLFAQGFVTEYRRFYSNAILHSKKDKGIL